MAKITAMRALVPAVLAALLVCACGSSQTITSGTFTTPATAPAGSTPAATTTTASTPAPTTTGTTTTATVPAGLCTASGLALSFLGQQGATGHGELGFLLTNRTAHSCHTFGYPGIQFLTNTGAALPTNSTRTTHDFFGTAPEQSLTIAPGDSFSFRIGVTHFGAGGSTTGCTTAAALAVIPPDDTASLHVSIPQGAYECATASVSPVRPGNSAYP